VRAARVRFPSGAVDRLTRSNQLSEENTMKNAIIKTLTIGAAAVLATGCVSTSTFNDHVAKADAAIAAAAQQAAAAKSAADAASASASSAANAASSAQSTANQALQAAQGAQACCDATNEKIDRAFKRSMGK
jgi:hypothetical protein